MPALSTRTRLLTDMRRTARFCLVAALGVLAWGCNDGPSDYAASTAPAPAVTSPEASGAAPVNTVADRRYANSPGDGYLALRSDPSVQSGSRLAQIPHGSAVEIGACDGPAETIGGRQGRWCSASYGNQVGYVFDAYLAASQPAPRAASRPASQPSRSRASGGGYTLGPNPNREYTGSVYLAGEVVFCETYDRTSVASFRGMELCYRVNMNQHPRDGSLSGSGRKISEQTRANGYRDLPPGEQSPVRVSGYIDGSNTIHLEYTVQGARRATKAVAQYRPDPGSPDDYVGSFRTDAANASGSAGLSAY